MKIDTLKIGNMDNRCYLVTDDVTGECVLIDPSFDTPELLDVVKRAGEKLKYILLTHRHFDHILGAYSAAKNSSAKVAVSALDACGLQSGDYSLSDCCDEVQHPLTPDIELSDEDELSFGSLIIKTMHTPGHTLGSVCFIIDDVIFSGDTVFRGSIGRVDLPTGSYSMMVKSLEKLVALKGDYHIYPGHGPKTTLEYEKIHNPYMREVQ